MFFCGDLGACGFFGSFGSLGAWDPCELALRPRLPPVASRAFKRDMRVCFVQALTIALPFLLPPVYHILAGLS